jgi:hypothetical protein
LGGWPGLAHLRDLLVQLADLGQAVVHLRGIQAQLAVGRLDQRLDLPADAVDAVGELARAGQEGLARGQVGRPVGQVAGGGEERVERGAQAQLAVGEQAVQRLQAGGAGAVGRAHGGGRLHGGGEELVVLAPHRGHVDAAAEEAGAGELPACRGQLHLLARIAGRAGVGDVVRDRVDRSLHREQRPRTDGEDGSHGWLSPARVAAPACG